MIIYKATNTVNGKVYIGKYEGQYFTTRKSGHKYQAFKLNSQYAFHRAIRKHGWDAFEWSIIDSADSKAELCEKEKYWIDYHKSWTAREDCNGYNMTIGGDGVSGFEITEEYRESMSHLTKDDVYQIKLLLRDSDLSAIQICDQFNIAKETLSRINHGLVWGYVQLTDCDPLPYRLRKRANVLRYNVSDRYLSLDVVYDIRQDYIDGMTTADIAEKYSISYPSADNIIKLKNYPDVSIPQGYEAPIIKTQITEEMRQEIIKLYTTTRLSQREIGEQFGLSQSRVGQICKDMNIKREKLKPCTTKLNDSQVREIKILLSQGVSSAECGRRFGVNERTIGAIKAGQTWKHVTIEGDKTLAV